MSISLLLLCSNLLRPFEYWLWCWVYDFLVFRFPLIWLPPFESVVEKDRLSLRGAERRGNLLGVSDKVD